MWHVHVIKRQAHRYLHSTYGHMSTLIVYTPYVNFVYVTCQVLTQDFMET
jgi:hypothetical protein